ncbi:subtilisin-like protease SBT5.5 [Carex rostrata]
MKNTSLPLYIFLSTLVFFIALPITMTQEVKPFMVYMRHPPGGMDSNTFQIAALSKVLGSEEAARKALVYHYTDVVSGFSAKLTPQQAQELKKVPEVTDVKPSEPYKLSDPFLQF